MAEYDVVAEINRARQEQQLAGALALGCLLFELMKPPPPRPLRARWWQLWRARGPITPPDDDGTRPPPPSPNMPPADPPFPDGPRR